MTFRIELTTHNWAEKFQIAAAGRKLRTPVPNSVIRSETDREAILRFMSFIRDCMTNFQAANEDLFFTTGPTRLGPPQPESEDESVAGVDGAVR